MLTAVYTCNQTKEIVIKLFEYRHNVGIFKKKERVPVVYIKIALEEDELYTEKTYQSECLFCQLNK